MKYLIANNLHERQAIFKIDLKILRCATNFFLFLACEMCKLSNETCNIGTKRKRK